MKANYTRNILPLPRVTVPRIIYPMHFPQETVYIASAVDIDHMELGACVGKHCLGPDRFVYVQRLMHLPPKGKKA